MLYKLSDNNWVMFALTNDANDSEWWQCESHPNGYWGWYKVTNRPANAAPPREHPCSNKKFKPSTALEFLLITGKPLKYPESGKPCQWVYNNSEVWAV